MNKPNPQPSPRRWGHAALADAAGLAIAVTALAGQAPALAQADMPAAATAGARPPMSFQQLIDHVVKQGYSDVNEVERKSDKLYEVKARDRNGAWVELLLDARSGEVLKTELEDKRRR